jgi:hypothetical protein
VDRATRRTIDLHAETDAFGGTRRIWLRRMDTGAVVLDGQDLGSAVTSFFGEGLFECEWSWTLPPERMSVLLDRLGVVEESPDLMDELARALKSLGSREMQTHFEHAGAAFWSRVGG